jgi:hypothetical protein
MAGGVDGKAGAGTAEGPPAGGTGGALPHAASIPTIASVATCRRSWFMILILLEALGALLILVLIVWWTMFSGRKKGEPNHADDRQDPPPPR